MLKQLGAAPQLPRPAQEPTVLSCATLFDQLIDASASLHLVSSIGAFHSATVCRNGLCALCTIAQRGAGMQAMLPVLPSSARGIRSIKH
jgi:hypothetical protein